jgi:hypothetical protein
VEEEIVVPPPLRRPWMAVGWVFGAVVVVAITWLVGSYWREQLAALPEAEATAFGQSIEGVYVNGAGAERGIVLGRAGAVRFFETKGDEPPAIGFDTWRAVRENDTVRLQLIDKQVPIAIVDPDTIMLAGETYRRAMRP